MHRRWGRAIAIVFASTSAAVVLVACGNDGSASGSEAAAGKSVFLKAGCAACHTLSDAGATGTVGANLDELKPSALKVEVFVTNGSPPTMPSFKGTLSEAEIEAVAAYVSEVTGGDEE